MGHVLPRQTDNSPPSASVWPCLAITRFASTAFGVCQCVIDRLTQRLISPLSATRSRSHACQIAEIYPQPSLLAFLPLNPPFPPSFHHLSFANYASHRRHRQLQGTNLSFLSHLSSVLNSPLSLTTR